MIKILLSFLLYHLAAPYSIAFATESSVQSHQVTMTTLRAQSSTVPSPSFDPNAVIAFLALILAVVFLLYFFYCMPVYILAKKTKTAKAWMTWIPIANLYLLAKIAGKPGWWMLMMLIPIVNIVFFTLTWMGISQVRQKPQWLGLLSLIPFVNIVLMWYLALSQEKDTYPTNT